jgi:glutaredoxin-like YruB-family protein
MFINKVSSINDLNNQEMIKRKLIHTAGNEVHENSGLSVEPLKTVTVYSTQGCSWCNALKSWLRENHVPFHDIDVSQDRAAASEMVRLSGQQGVPQTYVNGKLVLGFDQQRLEDLLEIKD